jgi:hypothetical protein
LIKLRRFDDTGVGEGREEAGDVIACLDVGRVNVGGPSSLVGHDTMVYGAGDYMLIGRLTTGLRQGCRSRIAEPGDANRVASPRATNRQDQRYSSNERFLRAQDAELVALGVGEHGPRLRAALPDIDPACAERENPFDLGVAAR